MTESDALKMIQEALNKASPGAGDNVTMDTHLTNDGVVDSLDLMNFLFELEGLRGGPIEEITETFDDYRVATLVNFLTKAN